MILASYGYQSLGAVSYKHHSLFDGSKSRFLERYLEERRRDEVEILRQLAPHLAANRGNLWALTLIAKQDLWFPSAAEVRRHYQDGDYGKVVADLSQHLGGRSFRHEFVYASLVIRNFKTGVGETLAENVAGYDQPAQAASLRRLIETVDALRQWEAQQ